MDTPYKFCILGKDNTPKQMIVFSNNTENADSSIFNDKEREFIETNSIPIQFSNQQIHKDDSISTIKNKFLKEIDFAVSYQEIYLFSNIENPYKNLQMVFDNISGKGDFIDRSTYEQFLINFGISDIIIETLDDHKSRFFLEDVQKIKNDSFLYKLSIGKRFRIVHDELFSANPFDILKTTKLNHKSTNPLESFENQLLLNNNGGKFIDNTIFVCLAEDVLEYIYETGLNAEIIVSLYFPLLIKYDIIDTDLLLKKRGELVKKTKKIASEYIFKTYESVDMLYNIYNNRLKELQYESKGITIFSLFIHPDVKNILPLDTIFKNVHSTKTIPFIKYNPGFRHENIYRFYSEDITKYGTKIPFLSPKTILKLAKETGKKKQISFSIENENGDFYIDIQTNGDIHISGNNFRKPIEIESLNEIIRNIANPVIEHMNDFLRKNGYEIKKFQDIRRDDIEIEYMQYTSSMKVKKEIDLSKYTDCFSTIFDMNDLPDIHKGVDFTFKRVENYNEMNEEDVYIASLHGKNKSDREIADAIAKKYDIGFAEASMHLASFIKNHERVHGKFVSTSLKIADSPGFSVKMNIESYNDLFTCIIDCDNMTIPLYVDYIDVIQIYIDSLLRITQEPASTSVSIKNILSKCNKQVNKKQSNVEKYDNVVVGIETTDDIMYLDTYEEEVPEYKEELMESTAFGDLKQYESVDISNEIDDIQSYSSYDILSPISIEKPDSEKLSVNSLMFAQDETTSENSKKSSASSTNSLMFAQDESDESSVSNDKKSGGSEIEKKLDGMVLKDNNNNIFLSRLKKKEPTLFLSEDDGKFDAYSKLCQASRQRQPVILSQEEKDRIDENDKKNNSKSYNHALEYGTDPENKNWYICPRYWCLKTNSAISEEDVKAGKCGKIIAKGDKVVKKGHYVYEFNHEIQHHSKDGSYKENTPGFLEGSLHPKGHCLPCCFKKDWESRSQVERRQECSAEPGTTFNKKDKRPKNAKQEEYVYEIRRYPIPQKRWGFLPMAVQLFLQTDNSLSVNPNNNKYLRDDKNTQTLLRYGVENSEKQSFIACIADIYASKQKIEVPSIVQMCNIIKDAVSIDLFLKYQNGSLASIFKPQTYNMDDIDPTKYESSQFLQRLDMGNDMHIEYIYDTIASYENFISFLTNESSYIDHTYLWDIVCSPNPKLFQTGCNLAIMRIREVDITDDIEILCPTSVYSSILYDMRKETVLLLKHDNYYEPIYLFDSIVDSVDASKKKDKTNKREMIIKKTFLEDVSIDNIKEVLQIIRNSIQKYCSPQSSMPRLYKFRRPMPVETLKIIFLKYKFEIKNQVLNYQGKTVGFWIKARDDGIFVPCLPSSQLPDIPIKFIDDDTLWIDYKTTRDRLKKIHSITNGEISCRPKFKVMEDGLIIGIITETNQFLMISTPTENIEPDGIPVINDENYIIADKTIIQKKEQDVSRIKTIKMISLETQFYMAFRTTIRTLLNRIENKQYKQQLNEIIENPRYLYKSKLDTIERILRRISSNAISFKMFDEETLLTLDEITDCFWNANEKKYCIIQKNGEAQIIIPEKHLISGLNNKNIYFARCADELIRYKRIQLFMMDAKMYLNITNTDYKINPDEMIMLESLLTADYFKSIEPYEHGKTTKITYEIANPIITQKYTNEITIESQREMLLADKSKEDMQDIMGIECIRLSIPNIIGKPNSEWRTFFPKNATETELHSSVKCSYYPIIAIYNNIYNIQMTVEQVKQSLANEYAKYTEKYQTVILNILRKQGKRDMIIDIINGKYTLETAIASEVYYLTNLDLWVLATGLKLPIILFHQKRLKHLVESVNWLKLSNVEKEQSQEYYFIRVPTEKDNIGNYLPQYNMIKPSMKTNTKEITQLFSNGSPNSQISLENYLANAQK
jgi:hypothetical protein